ncbi:MULTISPECIES: hypothetical protein [unclassified Streptomyces]|uniref:hypothetical protein n=1 Tax=unclassified Streptomyces TaxID=2593676 RepID=UPI000DBA562F|nr:MULTISPECIES: hypothetical protein [Streptomyces]MYU07004.1 hypothetical protein [Streptomyces sp. SID8366]RAJ61240.1 hypothetical protein K376_02091 [Streptomyces sp. PsTaAH-130]TXJ76028.1 hypothetical protein E2C11_19630 [Streptomyces lavendulae]
MGKRNRKNGKARAPGPRAGRDCGAPLPARRNARPRAGDVAPGAGHWRGHGPGNQWLLLPGGTWRRVETIRVRGLFG